MRDARSTGPPATCAVSEKLTTSDLGRACPLLPRAATRRELELSTPHVSCDSVSRAHPATGSLRRVE